MKISIDINDDLYELALKAAEPGLDNTSDIFHEALKAYVRIQNANRLAKLGGKATAIPDISRRRVEPPRE
ncbi:type II toxin-antitoxin system VapB family antitoxin [Halomonas sp. QX-2]|uniref:Type II toxin-antitoxin system VapB family antitoxin n=1 Tax=Vreelandella sedimenti TaxID=2729618 RepID=A0A7Z0SLR0_9GAMM|nr:type II toxin-antitoxin system VapB family antitoxin [Halomonas sedimenti]NYT72787.1 type II toxin-antitoxin system VapB family antitoxin [Halomonas sedimenti]